MGFVRFVLLILFKKKKKKKKNTSQSVTVRLNCSDQKTFGPRNFEPGAAAAAALDSAQPLGRVTSRPLWARRRDCDRAAESSGDQGRRRTASSGLTDDLKMVRSAFLRPSGTGSTLI
jgi:hypothetical protein